MLFAFAGSADRLGEGVFGSRGQYLLGEGSHRLRLKVAEEVLTPTSRIIDNVVVHIAKQKKEKQERREKLGKNLSSTKAEEQRKLAWVEMEMTIQGEITNFNRWQGTTKYCSRQSYTAVRGILKNLLTQFLERFLFIKPSFYGRFIINYKSLW